MEQSWNRPITINNNIEHEIHNTIDILPYECLFFKVTEIQKDSIIPESTENYHSNESYDLMTITINGIVELNICDFSTYFTAYISLKKPVACNILKDILNKIFYTLKLHQIFSKKMKSRITQKLE